MKEGQDDADIGQAWLFHGCRHRDHDFLFRQELQHFAGGPILHKLLVASSRDNHEKHYVQHYFADYAEDLARLMLDENAVMYVCGNAATMVAQLDAAVDAALIQVGKKLKLLPDLMFYVFFCRLAI